MFLMACGSKSAMRTIAPWLIPQALIGSGNRPVSDLLRDLLEPDETGELAHFFLLIVAQLE